MKSHDTGVHVYKQPSTEVLGQSAVNFRLVKIETVLESVAVIGY